MNNTPIEWVKNPDGTQGFSSNPIKGYCPIACPYCYARALYDRFGWDKTIRFDVEELLSIERHKKPAGIFLGSTFELFWDGLERFWQDSIFATIKACSQHRFYLLTKQPQNLPQFSPYPDNCFVGYTATSQDVLYEGSLYIRDIEAKVKYVSLEPCLDFNFFHPEDLQWVNWVIIGAQTKPYKPPEIEWVEETVRACDKAGIQVFLKDNLWDLLYTNAFDNGIFWANEKAKLRQEMPK